MTITLLPKTDKRKPYADPKPAWGIEPNGIVFIRCACGVCASISDTHEIDTQGNVTPSVWHDEESGGCGWHVMAVLVGWGILDEK
jgi:hypothetical protein